MSLIAMAVVGVVTRIIVSATSEELSMASSKLTAMVTSMIVQLLLSSKSTH